MRRTTAFLLIASLLICGYFYAVANGPIAANGTTAIKYPASAFPLVYKVDRGGLGAFSNTIATGIADYAFQQWDNVSSASLSFSNGGQLARNVTSANDAYISGTGQFSDGVNPVIFDSSGAITDGKLGVGAKSVVLGFAASAWNGSGFTEGYVIINGFLSGSGSTSSQDIYKATITHEVGHFLGLSHTQISMHGVFATMYPQIIQSSQKTLSPDDTASIVRLYPTTGWAARTATISGTVKRPNNANLSGVNVIAMDSASGSAYSTIVDYFSGGNTNSFSSPPSASGSYSLSGLPPGTYFVRIEPINANFSGGSSIASYSTPANTSVAREWYNGANEGGDMLADNTNEKTGLQLAANSTTTGINFTSNESSTLGSVSNDNGTASVLMPLPYQGITKYAVKFTAPSNGSLLGVKFRLDGTGSTLPLNGTLTITVHANTSGSLAGIPGTALGSVTIPFSDLETDQVNEIWLRGLGTAVNFSSGDNFHVSFSTNGAGTLGFYADNGSSTSNQSSYYTSSTGWRNYPQGYPSGTPGYNLMVTAVYSSSVAGNPQPAVSLSPTSLDFGRVRPGSSVNKTITLTNSGTATLNVSAASISGQDSAAFSIVSNGGSFTLSAGSSRTITLRFAPAVAGGSKSATLTLVSNAATSPNTVPLLGQAVEPYASKLVTSIDFGPRRTGGNYSLAVAAIRNTGNDTLHISGTTLSGADAGTAITFTGNGGAKILPPDSTDTLQLRFTPTQRRQYSATIRVAHDDTSGATSFAVTGLGIAPVFSTAVDTLALGNVRVGTSKTSSLYYIRNSGDAPMIVSGIALAGGDSSAFSLVAPTTLPATIAAGDSLPVQVRFTPDARRLFTTGLRVTHDGAGSPTTRAVTGRGIAPKLAVAPTLTIPSVRVGGTASGSITVTNSGDAPLRIGQVEIVGPDSSQFVVLTPPAIPDTLAPSEQVALAVRFLPVGVPGLRTAWLRIHSDDPDQPARDVKIDVSATQGELTLGSSIVDFGDVKVSDVDDVTLDLANTGTDSLTVLSADVAGAEFQTVGTSVVGTSIAAGKHLALRIRFSPASVGVKTGTLTLTTDVSQTSSIVQLIGRGVEAGLSVNRSTIDFGQVKTGISRVDSFVVQNTGSAPLVGLTIQLAGASASAFSTDAPASPITLQSGESRTYHVTLGMQQSAGSLTAQIMVAGGNGQSRQIDVRAGIVSSTIAAPVLIDFGTRHAVSSPFDTTLVVRNTGTEAFSIIGTATTSKRSDNVVGGFFSASLQGSSNVLPGDSTSIVVTFEPRAISLGAEPASFTGTLTLTTTSPIDPAWTVALRGETGAPAAVPQEVVSSSGISLALRPIVPNPARALVDLVLAVEGSGQTRYEVSIADLTGRRVADCASGVIAGGSLREERIPLDLTALPSGSYQVIVTTPGGSLMQRLLLVR